MEEKLLRAFGMELEACKAAVEIGHGDEVLGDAGLRVTRRNKRCSDEGRKEELVMGLDRGCCLDPKWIECRGRLREVAGCGGVGEAAAASVVVEGIDGDWPMAEIEERLWIGCGIETDPEVGDDKVECGGGDWTGEDP